MKSLDPLRAKKIFIRKKNICIIPFLHFARGKLLIDIQMKFQKDILNGFQLRKQTRFYDKVQKEIIPKE